jgi:predicted dehydrogenase
MNIALIGYGYWGPNLARNINQITSADFYGVSEISDERLQKAKNVYGDKIQYTNDYHDFINDEKVDAVAIATPTEHSFNIAMEALEAGKHVFIEKPIATTVERAEKIAAKAKEKELIVHCDHIMIYHPVIRYIKNMIDTGVLGDILYIDISRTNLGPIRRDINALLDLAVHDIAVIDFLSNSPDFTELSAMGKVCYGKQETLTFLNIKYPDFIASIKSSWISPVKERRTVVAGTKKMAIFDDMAPSDKLIIYDRGFEVNETDEYGEYEVRTRTGDIFMPHIEAEDALRNSLEHFAQCIKQKRESLSGPVQSVKVMKVLEKAIAQLKNN